MGNSCQDREFNEVSVSALTVSGQQEAVAV
jgi:hypothetical protein